MVSGSVSATSYNVTPGHNAIKNAINTAHSGDTLNLNGTYYEHDLVINKNLTIQGPKKTGDQRAVIDANNSGRIFLINPGFKLNLNYLQLRNGYTSSNKTNPNGGAIYNNKGTLSVNDTKINSNYANYGSGIYNYKGIATLNNSPIFLDVAYYNGGGIYNTGTMTLNNVTLFKNIARYNYGGSIYNFGTISISNSKIFKNYAKYAGGGLYNNVYTAKITQTNIFQNYAAKGGGIFNNVGTLNMTFCRITNNQINHGSDLFNVGGHVYVPYNWWGTNNVTSLNIYGLSNFAPWLVLKLTTNSKYILSTGSTQVNADFRYDSKGLYHNPTNGHLVDDVPIYFMTSYGSLSSNVNNTSNGLATVILNGNSDIGISQLSATDNQTVYGYLDIGITPAVTDIDPLNNSKNNPTSQSITITFNVPIQSINKNHIYLTNSFGTTIVTNKSFIGNILTITPTSPLSENIYTINLLNDSITDAAGVSMTNNWTSNFSVGSGPIILSSNPSSGSIVTSINSIRITFNKNAVINDPTQIILVDSHGTIIPISLTTNANTLTINTSLLTTGNYLLTLNDGTITDVYGNPITGTKIAFEVV
jgi:hypothetical protein